MVVRGAYDDDDICHGVQKVRMQVVLRGDIRMVHRRIDVRKVVGPRGDVRRDQMQVGRYGDVQKVQMVVDHRGDAQMGQMVEVRVDQSRRIQDPMVP